ncbi:MAG: TetR/AcrR family transcriptional regulator [Eubacterium sp.]|nr:TetR/AcrR family transcriptional regulator [Eubacterium sp.]
MDLRIEKTEKAIKNAFIELRSQKPLEKITVRELCTLACINKSTFYAHYADIYALSAALESETVASVLKDVAYAQPYSAENPEAFTKALCLSFLSHSSLIQILFSGKEQGCLASKLEAEIKKTIYQTYPAYQNDAEKKILLSYCIQGAFHAYLNNQEIDAAVLLRVIETIVKTLKPLHCS